MKILLSCRFFLRREKKNKQNEKFSFRRTRNESTQTNTRHWVAHRLVVVALYPTQKSLFCLLLTSSYTATNIFIFGSYHQDPVNPCLFPCTLRPSNTPGSSNAQTPQEGAWLWLTVCADLDVYCDWKIPPLNVSHLQPHFSLSHCTIPGALTDKPQAHTETPSPQRHGERSSEKEQMGRTEQHWHRQPQLRPGCSQLQLQNGPGPWNFITPLLDEAD